MKNNKYLSLKEIVENFDGRLTDSDRAILSVFMNDPKSAVFLSVAQMADKTKVHKSTVVRFAHKLGFEGYPELRTQIRSEVHPEAVLDKRSQQRLESIEQGSNLKTLIESEIAALKAISESLSQDQIDQAVELLVKARTIYIVGRGSAGPLAMHLDRRLRRIGYQTNVALNLQRRDMAEKFMALSKDDAVIFFVRGVRMKAPTPEDSQDRIIRENSLLQQILGNAISNDPLASDLILRVDGIRYYRNKPKCNI